ncbi:MAG: general secretion pathway protein GspK [Deltaproteobacteria bacterium]|nr:general secretion pathway protein GspK [Deltaproteobacteria bacterium]
MKKLGSFSFKRRGLALMVTLAVVLVLTVYMTEYFFAAGLELRAMQSYQESQRGRSLAASGFKALTMAMMMDEREFWPLYQKMSQGMGLVAFPLGNGYLTALEVIPQDGYYNLNRFATVRGGTPQNIALWNLFRNELAEINIPPKEKGNEAVPLPEQTIADLFSAMNDWIDPDGLDYTGAGFGQGAEDSVYLLTAPEYRTRNAPLDRLEEIRLVRGFAESRLPWKEVQSRFTLVERSELTGNLYPGVICVNTASRDEIAHFLKMREMDSASTNALGGGFGAIQEEINRYARKADDIAEALAGNLEDPPEGFKGYDFSALDTELIRLGLNPGVTRQLFSVWNEYYRIRMRVEVNRVGVEVRALVRIPRSQTRVGSAVEVLEYQAR